MRKGMPIDGASLYAWTIARQLDRIGMLTGEGFHQGVNYLGSLASAKTRTDKAFKLEWESIHSTLKEGEPITDQTRWAELACIVASLGRAGVMGKKPLPHDSLDPQEDEEGLELEDDLSSPQT